MSRKVLITGTTGFIGYHLAERLVRIGYQAMCNGIENWRMGLGVVLPEWRLARCDNHFALSLRLSPPT